MQDANQDPTNNPDIGVPISRATPAPDSKQSSSNAPPLQPERERKRDVGDAELRRSAELNRYVRFYDLSDVKQDQDIARRIQSAEEELALAELNERAQTRGSTPGGGGDPDPGPGGGGGGRRLPGPGGGRGAGLQLTQREMDYLEFFRGLAGKLDQPSTNTVFVHENPLLYIDASSDESLNKTWAGPVATNAEAWIKDSLNWIWGLTENKKLATFSVQIAKHRQNFLSLVQLIRLRNIARIRQVPWPKDSVTRMEEEDFCNLQKYYRRQK